MEKMIEKSLETYSLELASKSPTPGGGGTSALVAALGISLGSMVGELTIGKKKYADVEEDIKELVSKAGKLQEDFLKLVDADAEVFAPLAEAYSIPKDDPSRESIMEEALRNAASVPADIVRKTAKALDVIEGFAEKGSRLAISDAGCAATLSRAAMEAASLNVFINTKMMTDREYADGLNEEIIDLLNEYLVKADLIYKKVSDGLR